MQKILFIVPEDFGFVSHRMSLAKKMIALGWDVVLATRINEHKKIIEDAGIKLYDLSHSNNNIKRHSNIIATIFKLVLLYRREKPDIIHHFTIRMLILGTIASLFSGKIHVINTVTGLGSAFISNQFKYKVFRKIVTLTLRILLPNSDVTVQNNDDFKFIKELGVRESKIHLILGSGVDTQQYCTNNKTNLIPIIALPSRMLWAKGVGEFVDAAKTLKKIHNCRFVLVGDNDNNNPDSINNDQLIIWQHEGAIEWWGHHDDMSALLKKIDIVCLPSYREGLPKALLEAASAGLPIVTTNVPGCREVVDDKINGYLVSPKNFNALIEPLTNLIKSKKLRLDMGKLGRDKVINNLSSDVVDQQNIDLYLSLKK
jgi:glycosyltransferase involved in cell wall biosynthesis